MTHVPLRQGCEWNERSLNRGLNRGRGLGSDATFFWDSCSNLEIDENVRISHKLGLGLAAKISQAFAIQLVRYRDQYTPRPSAHPPKNPYLVCWCTLSGTCVDQMVRGWVHPTPYPQPPPSSPPTSPISPPHFPPPTPNFPHSQKVRDYFQRQYL